MGNQNRDIREHKRMERILMRKDGGNSTLKKRIALKLKDEKKHNLCKDDGSLHK